MIAPCDRLSTPETPKISVKPTAPSPYSALIAKPSTRICTASKRRGGRASAGDHCANLLNAQPLAVALVSFQNVLVVAWLETPNIGIGTCCSAHCTVGCTPTWLIPVMMTSGFSPSILLYTGVKSVVSGERRIWSSTL